jgi:hypothetical protein
VPPTSRRATTPKRKEPLPEPLPPDERTVGQLVAESIRLYGRRFWPSLALGLPVALADAVSLRLTVGESIVLFLAFAPVFTAAFVAASGLALGRPDRRSALVALAAGTLVFAVAAVFLPWFALAAAAWLAFLGLSVPAAVAERLGVVAALRRGAELARADFVHALGGLATLAIVFFVTRFPLAFLLRSQADNTERAAIFVADLVVSPLLFLGAALLYVDQAARLRLPESGSAGSPGTRQQAG